MKFKKITYHNHNKYITTPELSKLRAENFAARLAQVNSVRKTDFDNELINLNKNNSNKTKHALVEKEFKKLQAFDFIYFRGKGHFENDGTQNYLVFQPRQRNFKRVSNTNDHILSWKSKGLSDEIIKPPCTSTNVFNSLLNYIATKIRVELTRSCLKQERILVNHEKVVNIYSVYEINKNFNINSYPTLENCLFGAIK